MLVLVHVFSDLSLTLCFSFVICLFIYSLNKPSYVSDTALSFVFSNLIALDKSISWSDQNFLLVLGRFCRGFGS